jgi:DNA-binding protein HU-beta
MNVDDASLGLRSRQDVASLSSWNGAAMSERIQKKDVVQRLAQCMGTDEQTAEVWLDAFTETLYGAFKEGRSVTLSGLGGFYIRPHRDSWAFKFNPGQKLRALFGWSSSYKGKL